MIEVTEKAMAEFNNYFADKDKMPIRVYLAAGGWAGPRMSLALDEPKETDEVFEKDGLKFVIDKELLGNAAPVTVDVTYTGFIVHSNMQLGGGGGCGSSCGSGGCG